MPDFHNDCVTIVIVYTDLAKLNEAKSWIEKQTVYSDIELLALDNRENRFYSAAKALNYGAERASGDVLVFMHQDIYLWDSAAVEKYRTYLRKRPDAIIGVAGILAGSGVVMDIYETKEKIQRGIRANGQEFEVETLDECMFAMSKQTWERLRFDELCCDNWHGYAVDICIANTLAGGINVMVPLEICHDSLGNAENNSFRNTIGNLVKKYRKTDIRRIRSSCVDIPCSLRGYYWYRLKGYIKDVLRALGLRQ